MGRIFEAFEKAKSERRAALVIYLCAGDPDLETTARLIVAAAESGADVIELGMPFSDPTADGPAIQRASERSLARGTNLDAVLEVVRAARRSTRVPILLFGYYNPILAYGEEALVRDAKDAGADGFLVVDLPPEESAPLREPVVAAGLDYVPLVAPTSGPLRVERAARSATSFLYYVSLTGVTGASKGDLATASERAAILREQTGRPVAVGFGIKTPEDVALVAAKADGAVVGSAVVQAIESAASPDEAVREVSDMVSRFAKAARVPRAVPA